MFFLVCFDFCELSYYNEFCGFNLIYNYYIYNSIFEFKCVRICERLVLGGRYVRVSVVYVINC